MLDVDFFKKINDIFGHDIGDVALLQVVSRIKRKVRKSDKVGRYGGDEIIVILPNCPQAELFKIGERLRLAVSRRAIKTDLDTIPVTISAGCACSVEIPQPTAEKLIRSADEALLAAKGQGRNCVVVFNGSSKGRKNVKQP